MDSTSGSLDRLLGLGGEFLVLVLIFDLEEVLLVPLIAGGLLGELDLEGLLAGVILVSVRAIKGRHVGANDTLGALIGSVASSGWLRVVVGDQGTFSGHHCVSGLVLTDELLVSLLLSLEGEDLLAEAEQSRDEGEEGTDATNEVLDVEAAARVGQGNVDVAGA